VVLSTHVDLDSLVIFSSILVNVVSSFVSSYEGDCLDIFVFSDLLNCIETTMDKIDNSLRDSNFLKDINQILTCVWDTFRSLHDESVSASNCIREHPKRNHSREVES
jgi:hypothetical protein